MPLTDQLRQYIEKHGPMPVSDYMEVALTDPKAGYYTTRMPFGEEGDFTTSPEISQIFGEMLGLWAASWWQGVGQPRAHVIEMGPGRGTLMADFLRATAHVAGFHESIQVHLVEISPHLQTIQRKTLEGAHPHIHWHEALPDLPDTPIYIANEFFDALPIEQYITTPSGFAPRLVGWDGAFIWQQGEEVPRLPHAYPPLHAHELEVGKIVEVCPAAQAIMARICRAIKSQNGALLTVDYGHNQFPALGDTLQAAIAHQFHHVLEKPGRADITAHVDFHTLQAIAADAGLKSYYTTQGAFLQSLGGAVRLQQLSVKLEDVTQKRQLGEGYTRLVAPDQMGNLFKVLAVMKAGIDAPGFEVRPCN